jgi:RNA polymerase sporulation-specific sigma factor
MANNNVFFSKGIDYINMTDEQLIKLEKKHDEVATDVLIERYRDIVNAKVSKYYIAGAEKDDIIQEGLIGLFKAIKNFDETKQKSFKSFANLCVERQIITAIKGSNRQKHIPLNSYVSLTDNSYENSEGDEESQLLDVISSNETEDPLETVTKNEYYDNVKTTINKSLSNFEKEVLNRYIEGESYIQIAKSLNSPVKSIDNAIQRIRRKTAKNIENMT